MCVLRTQQWQSLCIMEHVSHGQLACTQQLRHLWVGGHCGCDQRGAQGAMVLRHCLKHPDATRTSAHKCTQLMWEKKCLDEELTASTPIFVANTCRRHVCHVHAYPQKYLEIKQVGWCELNPCKPEPAEACGRNSDTLHSFKCVWECVHTCAHVCLLRICSPHHPNGVARLIAA